jgi:predicted Zn-dependent protease
MTERRIELGLDPEGLRHKKCANCGMAEVRTVRGSDRSKQYYCRECGCSLGEEAAGTFEPPYYPDA